MLLHAAPNSLLHDLKHDPAAACMLPLLHAGFRERLLGDPSFPVKLAIELGIGLCMKLTAEKTKRGENFVREADFVLANVIMALIADFMLTWLPAPTLSFVWVPQLCSTSCCIGTPGPAQSSSHTLACLLVTLCSPKKQTSNALMNYLSRCPDNAFQVVQSGMEPFTLVQRIGAIVRNGTKLLGVGFCASMIGAQVSIPFQLKWIWITLRKVYKVADQI